ncbi:MAG: glycosyltransferase family 39 protein, partial [Spirochaetota bacterium]|nr:glycosyltransferase family 39 protein [Spirochaetota bacterium]
INKKTISILLSIILVIYFFNFLLRLNINYYPEKDEYFYYKHTKLVKNELLTKLPYEISHYFNNKNANIEITDFLIESKTTISNIFKPLLSTGFAYFLLMSPFLNENHELNNEPSSFFYWAAYINFILGLVLILFIYYFAKSLYGDRVGLISAFFISANPILLERTVMLASENFLILFSTLGLFYLNKGLEEKSKKWCIVLLYWFLGLTFAGIAFLSKPNGIFLPISFFFTILIILIFKWKSLENRNVYILISLLFLIIIIINLSVIVNLFYEREINLLTMQHSGRDLTEHFGIYNEIIKNTVPIDTLEIIKRFFIGFLKELHRYAVAFLTSIELIYNGHYIGNLGYIIVPFYFFILTMEKNVKRKYFFIIFSAVTLLSCIPTAAIDQSTARYSIMVIPLFYFYISPLIIYFYDWLREKLKIKKHYILYVVFAILIIINSIVYIKSFSKLSLFPKFAYEYQWALDWLKKNTKPGDVIMRDSNSRLSFDWYIPWIQEKMTTSIINNKDIDYSKMIDYFKKENVKYIIIDGKASYSPYNTSDYRYFFRKDVLRKNGQLVYNNNFFSDLGLKIAASDHTPPKWIIILQFINKK